METDTYTDTDIDTDTDTDTDTDIDIGTDTDTNTGSDTETDMDAVLNMGKDNFKRTPLKKLENVRKFYLNLVPYLTLKISFLPLKWRFKNEK
jgi:hypothetical protein